MPTTKRSLFRNSALVSGLVTRDQIDAAEEIIRAEAAAPHSVVEITDELLSAKLVEQEVLTSYQAAQLKSGRTKLNLGLYTITDFIGQGGMGQVYKAVHEIMGRECASKVLPREKCTPEAIAHFRREIRMQARLDHEYLVRAFDAGEEGKVHYLVTEYVPGTDLRKLVRSQSRLSVQQAARIVMQAALGLDYAHLRGLIHRDVKPGNILVTPEGTAKVSDLGLAGFMHEADQDPRAGKIVGTADYLAPEQIMDPNEITAISDIYSLGCTLYYAITGKVPYPGGSPSSKARRHLEETPWHPRNFNDEVNDEFVDIIADMMEKDPKNRIQSAGDVAARLEPWASESAPVPSQPMTKSPWMSPPLPTGSVEDDLGMTLHDTGSATYEPSDVSPPDLGSLSQISDGTNPATSSGEETRRLSEKRPPPLLPMDGGRKSKLSRTACVGISLAIAVPVSIVIGMILGFVLGITLSG